jgi:hypothetical protein
MLASTAAPRFQLRLPAGDRNTSLVNIVVEIQDTLNCVEQFELPSVVVMPEVDRMQTLIDDLQQPITEENDTQRIFDLPPNIGQNTFGQILTSISQGINDMNMHDVEIAIASKDTKCYFFTLCNKYFSISDGVPAASIFISPLGSYHEAEVSFNLFVCIL